MESSVATHVQVLSNSTLSDILDDLCIRFLLFLPEEELSSIERICFQIEEAHWFYEDFVREINPSVPNLHLRQFIHQLLNRVPRSLIAHIPLWKTETAFTEFMSYKTRVPVRGCIMLNVNMDKCILVKGWKSGASWSFPRGKIDQNEDDRDCAIRETLEETGFDLTGMVGVDDKIDVNIREQDMKLYIAPGVPEDFEFAPRTRKEISKISWHKLSDLPGYSSKKGQREPNGNVNGRQGRFFLVAPFMRDLRKWISTTGKQWLERQEQAAASKQEQLASAAENIAQAEDEDPSPPPPPMAPEDDSAAGLKNLLGISRPSPTSKSGYLSAAEQVNASRRLKDQLGGKSQTPTHATNGPSTYGPPPVASENTNAQALLSILQGSTPSQPAPPPQLPPTHSSARPGFMSFPMVSNQNQPPKMPVPPQHQVLTPLKTRQSLGPVFQDSPVSMPSPGAWQQRTNNYYLPSPPPTSRFGPPPQMLQHFQQHQQESVNQFYPNQPPTQPENVAHQFGPQLHNAPPTPVDSFYPQIPQPIVPAKPRDPGQAGALLSILKGTNVPAAILPTPGQQPELQGAQPSPPAPQQPPSIPQQPKPQPPQQVPVAPQKPVIPPVSTHRMDTRSIPLRSSPPRGPRSQTPQRNSPQRHTSQRHRMATSGRPSTTVPAQAYAPPPRPGTAGPQYVTPPPPLRRGTPVVIDHYGAQKPPTMPTTNFDRRESISGTRAQTLLAMFKQPSAASPAEEAVLSSPETEKVKTAVRTPRRLATPIGTQREVAKAKRPVGQAKANLLAYLEGVASENGSGGGVSLT